MKRQIDEDEEYEEYEEEYEEEEPRWFIEKFSWKQRNQYVDTQLEIMHKLIKMSYDVEDAGFAKKLEIKAQNIYIQIESLLEAETMDEVYKKCPEDNQDTEIVTVSDYITDEDAQDIGRKASTKHLKIYGRRPRKMIRYIDGEPTAINVYTKSTAEHTIETLI